MMRQRASRAQRPLPSMLRERISQTLDTVAAADQWRQLEPWPYPADSFRGQFANNDYLALRSHPQVLEAFREGLIEWGAGSGASPLVSGYSSAHHKLSEALGDWLGYPRVLLFSSGYAANQGTLHALQTLGGVPVLDRLSHASLYDGAKGSSIRRFHHNDVVHASKQVSALKQAQPEATPVIVSEGVFSMDGDLAPVSELSALARAQNGLFFLDDAHGLGVRGMHGRGAMDMHDAKSVDILTGTFGKAFGLGGAFVASDQQISDFLVQKCRHLIYSTAFSGAQAHAIHASLQIIQSEPERRGMLARNIARFQDFAAQLNLRMLPSDTPIQPLLVGSASAALALARALKEHHIRCIAIRAPTVPKGTERLRFTLSAGHSESDIDELFTALVRIFKSNKSLYEACVVR
ncbi:aminotransferase class I/II-fold pyridoxal phosphate-dependent enzyme [Aliidiomarina indica]|uniref:aminotransferase class I/II-fold pyridoxal phosphate-dependent enzyme n=1 Tax=Aliidiomarina indica TaxID=2749147 RepID=UPI00188E3EDD|nr:8-amino-7-oxononanoate synthase [Aliidiomarina indica]